MRGQISARVSALACASLYVCTVDSVPSYSSEHLDILQNPNPELHLFPKKCSNKVLVEAKTAREKGLPQICARLGSRKVWLLPLLKVGSSEHRKAKNREAATSLVRRYLNTVPKVHAFNLTCNVNSL